jgi:hypothetical protein
MKLPSAQHYAGDNAADRVHPRYGRKHLMVVDSLFLPVAFDNQSRSARSVSFGLEDPFTANHMISGWHVLSQNLFPCSMLEKRSVSNTTN